MRECWLRSSHHLRSVERKRFVRTNLKRPQYRFVRAAQQPHGSMVFRYKQLEMAADFYT